MGSFKNGWSSSTKEAWRLLQGVDECGKKFTQECKTRLSEHEISKWRGTFDAMCTKLENLLDEVTDLIDQGVPPETTLPRWGLNVVVESEKCIHQLANLEERGMYSDTVVQDTIEKTVVPTVDALIDFGKDLVKSHVDVKEVIQEDEEDSDAESSDFKLNEAQKSKAEE